MLLEELQDQATVSIEVAGRVLGISRPTAYRMAQMGQLPTIRCGVRRRVVPTRALFRMLQLLPMNDERAPARTPSQTFDAAPARPGSPTDQEKADDTHDNSDL